MTQTITRQAWQPREVAKSLNVPYSTVLALIKSGELGHVKAGRYYLVPDAELERFLAPGIQSGQAVEAPAKRNVA